MLVFPNAKINLGLNILSKRPDGYHDIETVFYPIGLTDALEAVPSVSEEPVTLHLSGIPIGGDPGRNLVMKAFNLLADRFDLPPLDIYLHKVIPFGAGLGGGSSDGAFMLLMLRDLFGLPLDEDELSRMASRLGADCAFFIRNRPVLARGVGDEFENIGVSLKGYYWVLVKPGVMVSTPEAYARVVPEVPVRNIAEILSRPVTGWKEVLKNDFEPSVFSKYPVIGQIKESLYRQGAVYASMSGSGSSVFGLFDSVPGDMVPLFPDCLTFTGECRW